MSLLKRGNVVQPSNTSGFLQLKIQGIKRETAANDDLDVVRDGGDPQFMANLTRLGQVKIHDAGQFVETVRHRIASL